MQSFQYVARNSKTGETVKAEIKAESEQSAARAIMKEGLTPLEIKSADASSSSLEKLLNRISSKDKVMFARQLATLINAGLPIVQSLTNVAQQTANKKLRGIINSVITDVEAGKPLSKALSKYPKVFDSVFISLVAAGEVSGTLDKSLERVADQQEKQAETLSKVRGAMAYPAVVISVMFVVMGFMMVSVLPQIETIYQDLGNVEFPLVTRVLLGASNVLAQYWWVVILVIVLVAAFGRQWYRTPSGKSSFDALKFKVPLFGRLYTKLYMARFSRVAASLVGSGIPLLQVLSVSSKAINNVHIENSLAAAAEKVKGGKALSLALRGNKYFPDLVPNMLDIGEKSGQLEEMLNKTADYYEKEVDNEIKTLSTLIEPALMVVIGIFALIVVAAVLLPIYGLANQINFGG